MNPSQTFKTWFICLFVLLLACRTAEVPLGLIRKVRSLSTPEATQEVRSTPTPQINVLATPPLDAGLPTGALPQLELSKNVELLGQIGGASKTILVQRQQDDSRYAYLGSGPNLLILDVTDPVNPTWLGQVLFPGILRDIDLVDHYAYVATAGGLWVVDVSEPTAPAKVTAYVPPLISAKDDTPLLVGVHDVEIVGDYAYVAAGEGGLRILNVSHPETPVEFSYLESPFMAHNVTIINAATAASAGPERLYAYVTSRINGLQIVDVSEPVFPVEANLHDTAGWNKVVIASNGYAYVAAGIDGLQIINISDPANPVIRAKPIDTSSMFPSGQEKFDGIPGAVSNVALAGVNQEEQPYLYVVDDEAGLLVLDISNPVAPVLVGLHEADFVSWGDYRMSLVDSQLYLADPGGGYRVVDVSDPAAPVEVGEYNIAGDADDVAVAADPDSEKVYAYVADGDGDSGLRIVDVSDPFAPAEIGFYDMPGATYSVAVADQAGSRYAYLDGPTKDRGMWLIEVTDPAAPMKVGEYSDCVEGTIWDLTTAGDHVYLTDWSTGLHIVDVSDPASPLQASFFEGDRANSVVVAESSGQRYAYVAFGQSGLRIFEVSDPSRPKRVGFYRIGGDAHRVVVAENENDGQRYAYLLTQDAGLYILDVTDPADPVETGVYEGLKLAQDIALVGPYAYVTDVSTGLSVLDVSDPARPTEVGYYNVPGWARGVTVVDDYIYVAAQNGGLFILRFVP